MIRRRAFFLIAAGSAALLTLSCLRDRVVAPDSPLPAVLAVDRPTVQLFRFARGKLVPADTVQISNNGDGVLGPVERVGGVDYRQGRSGWLQATVLNVDQNHALLILVPTYADEEQAQADTAVVVLKGAGAAELKRVTISARTLPGASFEFSVSPAAFTAAPGEPPAPQTLVVRNGGNGELEVRAPTIEYEGAATGWLSVAPAGGSQTAPAFSLQADPSGLPGGLHRAQLRFESLPTEETRALPATVPVQLNVGTPRLGVSTSALGFTLVYGDTAPATQTVLLTNAGAGSLAALGKVEVASIAYDQGATGWLRASTDTNRVELAAESGDIGPGDYQATMQLHSEGGGEQSVRVALAVEAPVLTLSGRTLSFGLVRGAAGLPAAKSVRATNTGAGTTESLGAVSLGQFTPAAPWVSASVDGTDVVVTPAAAASSLPAGSHQTRLPVQSAFGGRDTLAITMAVSRGTDGPVLVLSADEIGLSAIRGDPAPPPQLVRLSNAGGGSLGAASVAGVDYVGPAGWLAATLQDTTLTLAVTPGSLADGSHEATVRVSSQAGGDASVRVVLAVSSPILTASATSVSFSSEVGGPAGATHSIVLSNTGPGSYATLGTVTVGQVSYASGSGWLSAALSQETLILTLLAVPATAGTYSATVPVTSANGGALSIKATLTVAPSPASPDLVVAPASVRMYAVEGGASPASQTLLLSNGGGGTLGAFGATAGAGWLSTAVAGASVTLTANTSGLAAGPQSTIVTVTSANGGSEIVDVALVVAAPKLALSSTSASFRATVGGTAVPSLANVTLANTGAGDFATLGAVSLGSTASWLTATLPAGSNTIGLVADPGSMGAGSYQTKLPVSSAHGGGDTISVALTITPAATAADLVVSPSSLVFGAVQNGSDPASQTVTAANAGGGGVSQLGTLSLGNISYGGGATGWLARVLSGSTVDLSATTGSLAAGPYTADFAVISAAGGSENVHVLFNVDTAGTPALIALAAHQVQFAAVAGGADPAPRVVPIFNRGGTGLGVVSLGTISYGPGASGWLSGSSASNSDLTLVAALSGLPAAADTFTAFVPVTSQHGGSDSVAVTLILSQPRLTANALALSFAAAVAGSNPPSQQVRLSNTGAGSWASLGSVSVGSITYGSGGSGWLSANQSDSLVTVQASPGSLAPATYHATLPISSTLGGSQNVAVTLTVADSTASPVLALGTDSVTFVAVRGAASPQPVVVTLSNGGGGAFSALGTVAVGTVSYGGVSGWLGTPQVAGAGLTLAPATGALPVGSHRATVPVTSQYGGNRSLTVKVQVVQPVLTASALALSFTAPAGGASPANQSLTLSNTGGGTLDDLGTLSVQSVSYGAGANGWLAAPQSGASIASATLAFGVTPAGLAPGSYTASVVLASQYGGTQNVAVTLSVVRETDPPRLVLSAVSQRFSALVGGTDPEPQSIQLSNAGGGSLGAIGAGPAGYDPGASGWLHSSLAGTTLTVSARTGALPKGTYTATLPVTSAGGGSASLAVTFVVGSPRLTLTPRTVSFADTLGGSGPPAAVVSAANTGGGDQGSLGTISVLPIDYADDVSGWLTASLSGASVTLSAATAGLPARPMPYEAQVRVGSSYGGEDTVAVSFTVAPGGSPPRLALSVDSLRFASLVGQPDPVPQTVAGFNAGGGILGELSVRDVAYQGPASGWLPPPTIAGTQISLSPSTAGLPPGQHRATVTVASAAGGDAQLTVGLDLGQPVLGVSTRAITFSDTVGSQDVLRSQVFLANTGSGTRADLGTVVLGQVTYPQGGTGWLQTSPAPGGTVTGYLATIEAVAADVPEGTSLALVPFLSQWGGTDTVTVTLTARRPDRSFDLPTIELVRTVTIDGTQVTERIPGDSMVVTAAGGSTAQIGLRVGVRNAADTRLTLSGLRVGMPAYTAGTDDWISGAFLNRTSAWLTDPAELFVAIEPGGLALGRYEAQLVVRSEDSALAAVQPVTLKVVLLVQ